MRKIKHLPKVNSFTKLKAQAARLGARNGHKMLCMAKNTDWAWSRCVWCKAVVGIHLFALDESKQLSGNALALKCIRSCQPT